jgi:hypothetical protein
MSGIHQEDGSKGTWELEQIVLLTVYPFYLCLFEQFQDNNF